MAQRHTTVTLYTRKGEAFTVDAVDVPTIENHTWHFQRYLRTTINGKIIRLHNFLMGPAPRSLEWDHWDRNPLNNCRANLRLVTHTEQMLNKKLAKNNSSGHKGVSWHRGNNRWIAQIKIAGKIKHLGYFHSFPAAVAARQQAEKLR